MLETSEPVHASTGIDLPSNYKERDDLNLCMTYSLFASYINILQYTLHPQLRPCCQNIGTLYCSSRDLHGRMY